MKMPRRFLWSIPILAVLISSCGVMSSSVPRAFHPTGKYAISPQFEFAGTFVNGLALVDTKKDWGFIDKSGKYAITPDLGIAGDFADGIGLAPAGRSGSTLWGYIDVNGKFQISEQFRMGGNFSEGLAVAGNGNL